MSFRVANGKPVFFQSVADGGTDEIRVFLQLIQSLLHGLVDGFLDGLTHTFNLVHTAARLQTHKKLSRMQPNDVCVKSLSIILTVKKIEKKNWM